jgi:hypothetical protein
MLAACRACAGLFFPVDSFSSRPYEKSSILRQACSTTPWLHPESRGEFASTEYPRRAFLPVGKSGRKDGQTDILRRVYPEGDSRRAQDDSEGRRMTAQWAGPTDEHPA